MAGAHAACLLDVSPSGFSRKKVNIISPLFKYPTSSSHLPSFFSPLTSSFLLLPSYFLLLTSPLLLLPSYFLLLPSSLFPHSSLIASTGLMCIAR